jgi:molybdopterin biosynthesis enzyme
MNADTAPHQRIGRLSPLADVLAAIARIESVAARDVALADAYACVLAADVSAGRALPSLPVALRDGWAVDSDATRDAGPYAPLTLQSPPQRVDAFAPLPPGTDAVAPLDAVTVPGGASQVMAPVAPGEGVLPASGDVERGVVLCAAGSRLRGSDIAALSTAGITAVPIRRPRILIVNIRQRDAVLAAAVDLVARAASACGAQPEMLSDLDEALRRDEAGAVIAVGGTGAGRDDRSVIALARAGVVTCHGVALTPGETSAFGMSNGHPVLLMPGRVDAVLACWLIFGRPMMDRLAGARANDIPMKATLARKVTSTVGMAELVPLRRNGANVEPLASGYLSLQSLARADGWLLVAAESEGYPAGAAIEMRPLP